MKIDAHLTDEALAQELGARIAAVRLSRNLTQAALAAQAGVSKSTVERLEQGTSASTMAAFLRICRALGLVDRLELMLPEPAPSPVEAAKLQGRQRMRASRRKAAPQNGPNDGWTWKTE